MPETNTNYPQLFISLDDNGRSITPEEFDNADLDELWCYELVNGVLIVMEFLPNEEADMNEQLGCWLRDYQQNHPNGAILDATIYGQMVACGDNRRRADRVIWIGLGRLPKQKQTPTVVVDFVVRGEQGRDGDYATNRINYMAAGVMEYWIIDRNERTMVVFDNRDDKIRKQVIREEQSYKTPLLPGFQLTFAKLLELADRWAEEEEQD